MAISPCLSSIDIAASGRMSADARVVQDAPNFNPYIADVMELVDMQA